MTWHLILGLAVIAVVVTSAWLVCGTNAGVWVLDRYAHAHGGTWYQHRFLCPGCSKRCHIGRPGPAGTSCIHCTPPVHGGTR